MSVVILARAVSLGVFGGINQASVGSRVSGGRSLKKWDCKEEESFFAVGDINILKCVWEGVCSRKSGRDLKEQLILT